MTTLLSKLNNYLKQDSFYLDENGDILLEKIKTSALNLDNHILEILLKDEELKSVFFTEKNGILVFDKTKFIWTISNSEFLPDCYTSYKNKIGLIDLNGNFLKNSNDVVLSFPYKDCILEFDSTDENEKRTEVFLNETLAGNKIDTLLQSKCFSNAIKHSNLGSTPITEYDGENMVIKGNNLISMYSILPKFEGKIKCMYWDVLYNTESDQVPYNDSFKHSSWLTMMKNRLEVARKLLANSGIIMVHLDSNEMAHLKVLMDEMFDKANFLGIITCKVKAPSGVASGAQMIFDCSEYILVYSKKINEVQYNHIQEEAEIVDENSKTATFYKYLLEKVSYDDMEIVQKNGQETIYRIKKKDFVISTMTDKTALSYYNNYKKIFRIAALSGGREKEVAKIIAAQKDALESLFVFEHIPNKGKRAGQVCRDLIYKNGGILMLSDFCKVDNSKKHIIKMQHITSLFANDWWQGISKEGEVTLNNGKKPEILLKTLIEMTTNPNDYVLDAYFGTGTTGAVAMKMGRKFIGLEQLDEHFKRSIIRLNNVINGDQTGISNSVHWQGGGSFVSCELKKQNAEIIEEIYSANEATILDVYNKIIESPFVLNFEIDVNNLQNLKNIELFKSLDLDNQKKILIALLDKNLLYVNYSDIEDEDLGISAEDKAFSKSFYGE